MSKNGEPTIIFTDSEAVPWQNSKYAKGVRVKNLGKANGRAMQLVQFEPGATFPMHEHKGPEFVFLLEGDAVQNDCRLAAGWAAVAEQGAKVETGVRAGNLRRGVEGDGAFR